MCCLPATPAEATNTRVAYFNVFAALTCVTLCGWQLWYLNKVRRLAPDACCSLLAAAATAAATTASLCCLSVLTRLEQCCLLALLDAAAVAWRQAGWRA